MGVKGLNSVLENIPNSMYVNKLSIKELKNKTVAIDINNWLYQFLCAGRKGACGEIFNSKEEKITIILGLYRRVVFLLKNKIKPIFVFDGKPPFFKNTILEIRKENKKKAQEKIDKKEYKSIDEKKKLIQKASSLTKQDIKNSKKLFDLMGLPYINSPGEADAQLGYLSKSKLVDYIISEDSDIIVFGGNNIIRGFKASKNNYEVLNIDNVALTQIDLAKISILLGCDYFEGVKGIGKKRILKMIENKEIDFKLALTINEELVNKVVDNYLHPKVIEIEKIEFKTPNIEELKVFLSTFLELNIESINKSLVF